MAFTPIQTHTHTPTQRESETLRFSISKQVFKRVLKSLLESNRVTGKNLLLESNRVTKKNWLLESNKSNGQFLRITLE